jgi:hypothetical protein
MGGGFSRVSRSDAALALRARRPSPGWTLLGASEMALRRCACDPRVRDDETRDVALQRARAERQALVEVPVDRGRASHRIVSVEMTDEAERRGLVLALPASIEVTLVGDTGFEPVTSRM